jgi:hypothetical protein
LEEPSLLEISKSGEITIYRFLLVMTGRALAFRLELLVDGTGELTMRRAIVHSDKRNGTLMEEPIPISAEQVREFPASLKKADFWQLESEARDKTHYRTDGTPWVLEGVRNHETLSLSDVENGASQLR